MSEAVGAGVRILEWNSRQLALTVQFYVAARPRRPVFVCKALDDRGKVSLDWAEDRATRGRDPSADPVAETEGWAERSRGHRPLFLRDRHESAKSWGVRGLAPRYAPNIRFASKSSFRFSR